MAVSAADSLFVLLTASFLWASIVMTGALGENCDMDYIEKCYQEYDALIKPDKSVFNPKQPDLLDAAVERYSRNFLSETPCYAYVRQNCTNPVYHKYYRIEEATYSTYYKVASNTNQLKHALVAWKLGCFEEGVFGNCLSENPELDIPDSPEKGRDLTENDCRQIKTRVESCMESSLKECSPEGNPGKAVLKEMIPTFLKTAGCHNGNSASAVTLSLSVLLLTLATVLT